MVRSRKRGKNLFDSADNFSNKFTSFLDKLKEGHKRSTGGKFKPEKTIFRIGFKWYPEYLKALKRGYTNEDEKKPTYDEFVSEEYPRELTIYDNPRDFGEDNFKEGDIYISPYDPKAYKDQKGGMYRGNYDSGKESIDARDKKVLDLLAKQIYNAYIDRYNSLITKPEKNEEKTAGNIVNWYFSKKNKGGKINKNGLDKLLSKYIN